jgi:hypothetical protein
MNPVTPRTCLDDIESLIAKYPQDYAAGWNFVDRMVKAVVRLEDGDPSEAESLPCCNDFVIGGAT